MSRIIRFNAWLPELGYMLEDVAIGHGSVGFPFIDEPEDEFYQFLKTQVFITDDEDNLPTYMFDSGEDWCSITEEKHFVLLQFTGMLDARNKRGVSECDIYFEEDAQDTGDRRIYFVVTWINERAAFAMLEVSEYTQYLNNGFSAIERDFDGFYFELTQDSFNKMHYAGNVYQNPELLS